LIGIICLLAHLHRAAKLETRFQAGARSLILNPGHHILQTITWLLERNQILFSPINCVKLPGGSATVALCARLHSCQDSSERHYSPMILTNTRLRRRPSNSP
jgi:hypothetical protein